MTRAAAGQPPLPEDEWIKLFKLPAEPSRLDSLLVSGQIGNPRLKFELKLTQINIVSRLIIIRHQV